MGLFFFGGTCLVRVTGSKKRWWWSSLLCRCFEVIWECC